MRRFALSLAASSCLGFSQAAQYHVSPDGLDTHDGSSSHPWRTLTHAAAQLQPGDTLLVRGGSYAERLVLNGKNGTESQPVTIRNAEGHAPVVDGQTLTVPSGGIQGLVAFLNCSHLRFEGIEVANFVTSAAARIPAGIHIEGAGSGLQIRGCKVRRIWQSSTNGSANGFGIAVYGTSSAPLDGLVIDGCEVHDLRTGQSESVVLNGNVTNFAVINNTVHDCNNIGIDFIGYEGSAPEGFDRARNGVCAGNTVYNIDSAYNPGYGGGFTSGGGDRSAAGIYVDGGRDIIIERNHCHHCNFGAELASEDASGFTEGIILRNNLFHHNMNAGLIMGGYDRLRGRTRNCKILNNTFYRNDTDENWSGQVAIQFYFEDNIFQNNIVWASPVTKQMIVHYVTGGTAAQRAFPAGNVFDNNLYFVEGAESEAEFGLNPTGSGTSQGNQSYYGLAAWRTAVGGDAASAFHDPGFVTPAPSASPVAADFKITGASFARDKGDPGFVPAPGEKDFFGASRVAGGRVDAGMHEFMTPWQSWRDSHFQKPDGGPGAEALSDPDFDLVANLIEYSQGMNPSQPDAHLAPFAMSQGGHLRFQYRKAAPGLTYQVRVSTDLPGTSPWPLASGPEMNDGAGVYWRDFPLDGDRLFVKLEVSLP
ncbi:MAG TPA: right-handed parallel beta-helix repeat-containing protein [Prosthecobacter sp.]|nr:right-handed parallel beta-helix repeat-containing protein [Prosthecobacter sp.]HRK14438.1 right-handed parallel beta-helix repeat-containing protein [Prosthecobacter sp.]